MICYQRKAALCAFQGLRQFEKDEIMEVFGPYAETILNDQNMSQFILRNWSEKEAASLVKGLQAIIGQAIIVFEVNSEVKE